jgi:hypothetical protein
MNYGAAILAKHRWLVAVFTTLALATGALYGWSELSERPPANLPISLGLGDRRSVPFTVFGGGLYVVSLQLAGTYHRAELECRLGSLPLADYEEAAKASHRAPFPEDEVTLKPGHCEQQPANLSWSIYRRGTLVARDTRGPRYAISRIANISKNEASLELGSVQLAPGGDYILEVNSRTEARALGLRHPTVRLARHVWDAKNGIGLALVFLVVALAAAIAFLALAASMLVEGWRILGRRKPR